MALDPLFKIFGADHMIPSRFLLLNLFVLEYTMYVATITGQAFLWHQIRCIMGVLFLIGEDKEKPEVILELLDVVKNPR